MNKIQLIALVILLSSFYNYANAQQQDSIKQQRKNIIKFNLTANAFVDKAILFEYERILKNNQSFTVQSGHFAFAIPQLYDSARYETDVKKNGWSVAVDYRFYLKKENKYAAPRGIYLAPFMSYNYFNNERTMEIQSENGTWEPISFDSKINMFSLGGEIGYQFVFKNRWTIDLLLLGPSVTNYNVKTTLKGNLPEHELNENLQEILSNMLDDYPFLGDLLEDNTAESNGRLNTWDMGFRYSIHVGFCF